MQPREDWGIRITNKQESTQIKDFYNLVRIQWLKNMKIQLKS